MTSGTSPRLMRALAHPLRIQLLMELRDGPATSAILGRRTHQTRGNVSYHLRVLANAELIATESDQGTERERWWRLIALPELDALSLDGDAEVSHAAEALILERGRRLARFARRMSDGQVRKNRLEASRVSEMRFHLSATRQAELVAELDALLARWEHIGHAERDPSGDGEYVEVQLAVFSVADDE